jgi:hypothetical protein
MQRRLKLIIWQHFRHPMFEVGSRRNARFAHRSDDGWSTCSAESTGWKKMAYATSTRQSEEGAFHALSGRIATYFADRNGSGAQSTECNLRLNRRLLKELPLLPSHSWLHIAESVSRNGHSSHFIGVFTASRRADSPHSCTTAKPGIAAAGIAHDAAKIAS